MSLASQLRAAEAKLAQWAATAPSATQRRWYKYWRDKVSALLKLLSPPASPPAPVTPPNAPSAPTAVLVDNTASISWPAATATSAPITAYKLYLDGVTLIYTGGARATTHILNASQAAFYKVSAVDANGLESVLSAASNTVTASGTPNSDAHGPNKPSTPTLYSASGVAPYTVRVAVTTDQSIVGEVQSGMAGGRYEFKNGSTVLGSRPHPTLSGAYVGYAIHPDNVSAPTGSDTGSIISSSGDGEHYGTADNFYFSAKAATGDDVIDFTVTSIVVNAGRLWPKCGAETRQSTSAQSPYQNLALVINDQNQILLYGEGRSSVGGQASQSILGGGSPTVITLPFRMRKTRIHDIYLWEYATNPASPSWQTFGTSSVSLGDNVLSGLFANGCAMHYTLNSHAPASTAGFTHDANPGDSIPVSVLPYDAVGNPGTVSDPLTVTITNTGGGGGGTPPAGRSRGGIYAQGGQARDGSSVMDYFKAMHRAAVTFEENYATIAAVQANVQGTNPYFEFAPYEDSMRLDRASLYGFISAGDMILRNGDGSIAYFGGAGGDSYGLTPVLNHASVSPLWNNGSGKLYNGLNCAQIEARHRIDMWRNGGEGGYAYDHAQKNLANRASFFDDFHVTLSQWGLFTPGNVNAAYWRRYGLKLLIAELISLGLAQKVNGVAAPIDYEFWANVSQFYGNVDSDPAAVTDMLGQIHGGVIEGISGPVAGYWWGSGNLYDRLTNKVLAILRPNGHALFDAWVVPTYDSDHARQCRLNAAAALMFDDRGLFGPKINPEQYYSVYRNQFVWRKFFDVDTGTGVGRPLSAGGRMFAWLGERVGSPITGPGTNGLAVAEFDNGFIVANPLDTGGSRNWTAPRNVARVYCDDEPSVHDGRNVNSGATDLISGSDAYFYRKQ